MIETTILPAIFPHHDDHLERRLIRTDPFLDDFVPNEYTSGVYNDHIMNWRSEDGSARHAWQPPCKL